MQEEKRVRMWQDYAATALGMIGRVMAGENWTLPAYVEMAYPNSGVKDTRTAGEIKEDILRKLGVDPGNKEMQENGAI